MKIHYFFKKGLDSLRKSTKHGNTCHLHAPKITVQNIVPNFFFYFLNRHLSWRHQHNSIICLTLLPQGPIPPKKKVLADPWIWKVRQRFARCTHGINFPNVPLGKQSAQLSFSWNKHSKCCVAIRIRKRMHQPSVKNTFSVCMMTLTVGSCV